MKTRNTFLTIIILFTALFSWGQPWTEDFNAGIGSSYATGTLTLNGRDWTVKDAGNSGYGTSKMGAPAITINDDKEGAYITTPALNTCGTVSFKYAYINGNSTNVFKLQKSTDGSAWTDLETKTLGAAADQSYVDYSFDVNDASATLYIRVLSDDQNAHLFIEDFSVTAMAACSEPTSDATVMTFGSVTGSSMTVGWTDGDGANRIVMAKVGSAITFSPTDATTYTADADFSSATTYGDAKCVYNGSGSSVDLTGLNAGTTYYFEIYEHSCAAGSEDYYIGGTPLEGNQATTVSNPTAFQVDCGNSSKIKLSWTKPAGTYGTDWDGVAVFAREAASVDAVLDGSDDGSALVDGSGDYSSGTADNNSYCVANITTDIDGAIEVGALTADADYYFVAYAYKNGTPDAWSTGAAEVSGTATTLPDVTVLASTPNDGEVGLTWTNPAGTICWDNVIIIAREGAAVSADVTAANMGDANESVFSTFNADWSSKADANDIYDIYSGSTFASDNTDYAVYRGSGTSTTITGLTNGTEYHFKVFVAEGTSYSPGATISETPAVPAAPSIVITEVAGKGYDEDFNNEYIELTNTGASDVDITGWHLKYYEGALETDVTLTGTIAANSTFVIAARSSYKPAEISPDQSPVGFTFSINNDCYVELYNDAAVLQDEAGSSSDKFDDATNYEFIDCGGDNKTVANWEDHGISDGTPGVVNCTSCAEPTSDATVMAFGSVTGSSMTVGWTDGDGANRIVMAKEGSAITFAPTDGSTYSADTDFSSATTYGDAKCVYNGSGSSVDLTGLNAGTTYYFEIYEHSCAAGSEDYYIGGTPLEGNQTTTVSNPTAFQVGCETSSTIELSWTKPAGIHGTDWDGVAVFARQAASVDAVLDGTDDGSALTAILNAYGFGTPDNNSFCVANVTTDTDGAVTVQMLTADADYYFVAYTYKNGTPDEWSTGTAEIMGTATYPDVTVLATTSDDGEVGLTWTNPAATACWDNVIIVAREGAAVKNDVTATNMGLLDESNLSTANTDWSAKASANEIYDLYASLFADDNAEYAVYRGSGTSATITGLTNGTEYHFKVFVAKGTMFSTGVTISETPAVPAAPTIVITEVAGKGYDEDFNDEYIELTNTGASDVDITGWHLKYYEGALEEDVTLTGTIAANSTFVIAARSSYTAAISPDQSPVGFTFSINNPCYVELYNDAAVLQDEAGSSSDKFAKDINYEFTDCGGDNKTVANWENHGISDGTPGVVNCTSCIEPTSDATVMTFGSVTGSSMTVGWTDGDGINRIVMAKEGSAITFSPTDASTYSADTDFSSATTYGDAKCVYNGSGSSVDLTGLVGGTSYYFEVFEYGCSAGSEDYYTGGTPLVDNQMTDIDSVSDLDVGCKTNTTMDISWTAPTGIYDGVIIGVRNDNNPTHALSDDPATVNADVIFGDGYEYGGTAPKSYVVYKGAGTSVTVTGLTAGQEYKIKAYTYKGTTYSSASPTTTEASLGQNEVSAATGAGGNTEATVAWTNPDMACIDEIMIVAKDGGSVTNTPSGDGSAYTANVAFGVGTDLGASEFVVYKGTGTSETITTLTNGTTYHFTIFTRKGTAWSTGVEVTAIPNASTVFDYGDIVIVEVNTNHAAKGDIFSFICFEDITEGTAIDFNDQGWERSNVNYWGTAEGSIRMERNVSAGSIPAGTKITVVMHGAGKVNADFDIIINGGDTESDWTITELSGGSGFDLNGSDDIWIMQGGTWSDDGANKGLYDGKVLYGWTATGWADGKPGGGGGTECSNLYPGCECSETNASGFADKDKVKYTGAVTAATPREWIDRVNDELNWAGYADDATYDAGGSIGNTISLSVGNLTQSWVGDASVDWFSCSNWANYRIPTKDDNATLPSGVVINEPTIDDSEVAECKTLIIESGRTLTMALAGSDLEIYGDLQNDGTFSLTDGIVRMRGAATQTISGTDAIDFYNLQMNSSAVSLSRDIEISNVLTMTLGDITTNANKVIVSDPVAAAIVDYSTDSYISGNLRRSVNSTGSYDLPVGNAANYQLANINLNSSTAITLVDAFFSSSMGAVPAGLEVNGTYISNFVSPGYWDIDSDETGAVNFDITGYYRGCSAGELSVEPRSFALFQRHLPAWNWEDRGTHDNATQSITAGVITIKRAGYTEFSNFGGGFDTYPLPVELLYFSAKNENGSAKLEWATASEINNDYFLVQKSMDSKNFENIATINGAGNSNAKIEYSFIDDKLLNGNNYYRLKQMDFDGSYEFSDIEVLLSNDNKGTKLELERFINNENFVELDLINVEKNLTIEIYDGLGRKVYYKKLSNNDSNRVKMKINKTNFNNGIYFIKAADNSSVISKKFFD